MVALVSVKKGGVYIFYTPTLLANDLVEVGDMIIFTKGDLSGVKGSTNSMMIIQVTSSD